MPCYAVQTFHIAGAVAACMLAERQGDDPALIYVPGTYAGVEWPEGMTWAAIARNIWDAGEALSVDTLDSAPYRVMWGSEGVADDGGWIDVDEDADELGAQPDIVTDWIS